MGLRRWVRRLQSEAEILGGVLRLPDGAEVRYGQGEMLDALIAAINGREHRLLPYLRQMTTGEGIPGIIGAMEGVRAS